MRKVFEWQEGSVHPRGQEGQGTWGSVLVGPGPMGMVLSEWVHLPPLPQLLPIPRAG